MNNKLKVLSLFSGIGAFEKALERQNIPYDLVNYCEFDSKIAKAYSILHNVSESFNLGDICTINEKELSDFDLMTWGFPCQDISIGNIKGEGLKGNRSGLYYEGLRILQHKKPLYSVIENVDNLVSKKYELTFKQILKDLDDSGYNSYYKVLDANDYGIPQHRERIYIVSIRKDVDNGMFKMPEPFSYKLKWYEFINPYETRDLTGRQQRMVDSVRGLNNEIIKIEGIPQFDSAVLTLRQSGLRFQANDEHPTITAFYGKGGGNFTILAYKQHIGGITPRQCFKLMGFDYEDCDKLEQQGISWSTLYTMAGNSIVVNVLEQVFKELFINSVKAKHNVL